jgi:hypothetical protein
MSDIEVKGLDLSTPDSIKKGLNDIVESQKRLHESGRSLTENLEQKADDLKKISTRMTELEQRAKYGTRAPQDGEGALDKYVKRDGTMRIRGESTRTTPYQAGLLDDAPVCDWQADLQRSVQQYSIVSTLTKGGAPKSLQQCRDLMNRAPDSVKRIFADSSAVGAEWIPEVTLPMLERELAMERRVAGLFQEMSMSNKTEILPFLTSGLRPYKKIGASGDDPAQYTSSSLSTAARTITAGGLAVRAQVDEDAAEDAIIDAMPLIQQELITAIVDGEEDCIINGDVDAGHDTALASWNIRSRWGASGLGGSGDHRRCWDGLRARAFDVSNATNQNGAQTVAGFMTARSNLASPHGVGGDLMAIMSPEYYLVKALMFGNGTAAAAGVVTVDRYGPAATILTGELGQLMGVPIVLSEFLSADMPTSGKYTTSGATTSFLMVNRQRFKIGRLRGTSVEIDKDITRGVHELVATVRETFFTIDSASKKNVHLSYNLDAS